MGSHAVAVVLAFTACGRIDFSLREPPPVSRSRVVAATSSDRGALVSAGRVDDAGNLYLGGGFSGQADLGLGTIDATSVMNIYAASYDTDLAPRWVDVFDSPIATNQVQGMALTTDGVSVTGPFQGMVDIGATHIASAGGDDRFLVVLDPTTGAPLDAARYGGSADDDKGGGIAIDDDGTTFIGGGCNGGDFSFGGAVLAGADRDPCIGGISPTGTVVAQRRWVDQMAGGIVALERIGPDLIASGYFTTSATFDTCVLTAAGASDAFITRLAPDLSQRWVVQIASDGDDLAPALTTDAAGEIYFAGSTTSTSTLAVGGLSFPVEGGDGFVGKLDPDGTPRWARAIGGALLDEAHSVTVHDGIVIVAGSFAGTMSLDGLELVSAGDLDAFVAAFDAETGAALWAERFGGPLADSAHVVVAGAHQLYIAGYSTGPIDLGDTPSDGLFVATQSF